MFHYSAHDEVDRFPGTTRPINRWQRCRRRDQRRGNGLRRRNHPMRVLGFERSVKRKATHSQIRRRGYLDACFFSLLALRQDSVSKTSGLCATLCSLGLTAILLLIALVPPVYGQSITQDTIVAPASQVRQIGQPLEKVVGYFTSTTIPSIVVGFALQDGAPGGIYLYTTTTGSIAGPWRQTAIASSGNAYERAIAFTYPGDTYPGIIASIEPAGSPNHEIIWYQNPKNRGMDPTTNQWGVQVINSNSGCHDIRLADMDGDGKQDVICSASAILNTGSFIAFQNKDDDWRIINNVANLGDGVDVIGIAGSNSPHLVGANLADGNIYWYQNPCTRVPFRQSTPCPVSRAAGWTSHKISSADDGTASGNSFTTITNNGVDGVIAASNEEENGRVSPLGIAWFYPGADLSRPWNKVDLDSTYRDVHEINTGTWNGSIPYVIAAEEEQACPPAAPAGNLPAHQTPCRTAIFQYVDNAWQQKVLSQNSTHNQSVISWGNGLLMVGANHGVFGADPAIHAILIHP